MRRQFDEQLEELSPGDDLHGRDDRKAIDSRATR